MAKTEMGMRLKVGYAFFFLLFYFFLRLILFKFSNRIKQRDTRQKRGMPQAVYFWKQGCACLPPSPLHPFVSLCCGCCACFMPFPSSWAAAAERTQTFPYILIHFYCHAHEHTAPSTAKSNSQRAGGSFSFLFPRCLARKLKKRKNFFCTMNFCAFSTCMSRSSPVPPGQLLLSPAGNRFVVLVACLTVKNFHFPFYFFPPAVVAAKVTALG